jgi:hypothetical protein
MVTVRLNACDGPTATTRAGTSAWPSSSAAEVNPSYSASRLRSKPDDATSDLRPAFSASRALSSARSESCERNQSGMAAIGRSTAAVPDSSGPKTSPTARRTGSTGESSPPWESSVIRETLASTRATSSARDGRRGSSRS